MGCAPSRADVNRFWLLQASQSGRAARVKELLKDGAEANTYDDEGWSALSLAASDGHKDVCQVLIEAGADIDACANACKRTPLDCAAYCGHVETIQLLLEQGANPAHLDKDHSTPLHTACRRGHLEAAQALIAAGAPVNMQDMNGNTPLHAAVVGGHAEVVRLLCGRGAKVDLENNRHKTPLQLAFEEGLCNMDDIGRVLIKAGAQLSKAGRSRDGSTHLHLAAQCQDAEAVQRLLAAGFHVDHADNRGQTALHDAAYAGYTHMVEELIKGGANVDVRDVRGQTPLAQAAWNGHAEVARLLLDAGAHPELGDPEGRTPLYLACRRQHAHVTAALLEYGAQESNMPRTAAHYEEAVEYLRSIQSIMAEQGGSLAGYSGPSSLAGTSQSDFASFRLAGSISPTLSYTAGFLPTQLTTSVS